MKPLPFLFSMIFLCVFNVSAQDTGKKEDSLYRPLTFEERQDPRLLQQWRAKMDSIKFARHPEQKHSVIYIDLGVGVSYTGVSGLLGNYSLNYQTGRSLFTFRGLLAAPFELNLKPSGYYSPYDSDPDLGEYALMYGWRFTNHYNMAFSFSAGIAYDHYYFEHNVYHMPQQRMNIYNAGIPFEANWQVYRRRFGPSFGLKFLGDVAPHGFVGLGIDMGLGFHNTPKPQQ